MLNPGIVVNSGTTMTLEGLTFVGEVGGLATGGEKTLPLEKRGRIARLAYCSFDRSSAQHDYHSLVCLFAGPNGTPGEIYRCVIQGRVGLLPHKETRLRLRLRESLLGGGIHCGSGGDEPGTAIAFEMEGCALAAPERALMEPAWFRTTDTQWTTRRCLLEGNMLVNTNGPLTWSGERNLYRFAGYWGVEGVHSLLKWRARMNSPETDSAEGLPLQSDPRTWRLPPGSAPVGVGPDVDRIGRQDHPR